MKEGLVQKTGLSLNVTGLMEIFQLRPTTEIEDLMGVGGQHNKQMKLKTSQTFGHHGTKNVMLPL